MLLNLTNFINSFDKYEIRDILVSVLVLGFLFSLSEFTYSKFLFAVVIVGLAFVLHEMGHRYMAMSKGLSARFMAWPTGLFLSLLIGLFSGGTFIFAAPGAVMISEKVSVSGYRRKRFSKEDFGRISLAGPMMNVILAAVLLPFLNLHPLMYLGVYINLFLALFNLFPFPPLDGAKIMFWNRKIWLVTFGLVLASLLLFGSVSSLVFSLVLIITIAFILFGGMGYKPF